MQSSLYECVLYMGTAQAKMYLIFFPDKINAFDGRIHLLLPSAQYCE